MKIKTNFRRKIIISYLVCHMEKYHKQDVAPIEKENERDENYEASNPQIDSERTRNNYRFTPYFGKTYTEFINGRIKELGLSPRKDAVVMNSFVLGSDTFKCFSIISEYLSHVFVLDEGSM